MIGETILHYNILEKLGEGGMGVVYKAEDTKLERTVAIKFLPRQIAANTEERKRFKIEAKAAAALNHPNIATIHAIEEADDQIFIVMEYIEGQELSSIARNNGDAFSTDELIDYAFQIAKGLGVAHKKGIVHRDIKSSNIMISETSQVKIMDFGLAKFAGHTKLTKSGTTLGTVAYMSPEQARGETVDQRTDIWSLGVVLYEMLTGELPFKAEYEQAVIYSILNEEPQPVTDRRTDLPEAMTHLVTRALTKESESRYQDIEEMIEDLELIREGLKAGQIKIKKRSTKKPIFLYAGMTILLILLIIFGVYFFPKESHAIDSIAVLPLANLSGNPDKDYFADGMTETLIADLGKIRKLRVISRQSVMRYKGSDKPMQEIARDLRVDAIVEGAALQDGEKVRISVRLINAATDQQILNKRYDRDVRDVLSLHSEVARSIAQEIQIALTAEEQYLLTAARQVDPEAHEAYLKGRYNIRDWAKTGKLAVEYFETAVEKDPDFALAYTGLADAYLQSAHVGIPPHEAFPKALTAARKALEIDPMLTEAQTVLADCKYHYNWDWAATESGFQKAIQLNPGNSTAHWFYSGYLSTMKRFEEAIKHIKIAQGLDPLALNVHAFEARIHFYARDYDQAIEASLKTMELNPNVLPAHLWLGRAYLEKGMHSEAIETLEQAVERFKGHPFVRSALAQAYAEAGRGDMARKICDELVALFQKKYFPPHLVSLIFVSTEETNQALEWLLKAEQERDALLIWVNVDPGFDNLRSDTRFIELLKRMGLET